MTSNDPSSPGTQKNVAYCLIRPGPLYRSEAFHAGLRACGYDLRLTRPDAFRPDDVLVIWNRYQWQDLADANAMERAGGTVLVAENAYIWTGGISPHHLKDRPAYALARSYHNDDRTIREGPEDRWAALRVPVRPWRTDGGHILICPNRTFGTPGRVMPQTWAQDVAAKLGRSGREVRVRSHPGNDTPATPLARDLEGAYTCIIWNSSAGIHALAAGVPVVCYAPNWIASAASYENLAELEGVGDLTIALWSEKRGKAFQTIAHAQFSLEEIASGFAFRRVLA